MKNIGNLFFLAEKQLQKEKKEGKIPCYTEIDVIEYAILIRRWLDNNPNRIKKIMKLTREELKKNNRESRRRYYLKYGK
jgi:GrpB-like predicted nucleotidyltransferase (UPF0157 family)